MKDNFSTTPYMSSNLREYNRIYKEVNDIYRDAASKFGLSNSVFDILYTICEVGEGCLQKDVCDATFIPKQTVNSAIRKLEQEGYLTLSNGKGHSKHILLTESGHTLLKETIFPIVEAENEAFTELSFEECNLLSYIVNILLHCGKSFQNFKFKKLDKHFTLNNNVSRSFYENLIIRTFYL